MENNFNYFGEDNQWLFFSENHKNVIFFLNFNVNEIRNADQ